MRFAPTFCRIICAASMLSLGTSPGFAAGAAALTLKPVNQGIGNAGEAVAIALPIMAAGISAYKDDWNGVVDLGLVTAATVGTTFLLKQVVREQRPDGSDFHSFPSDQAALAFAPAFYLWHRYGWEYGVPALAAASFVGFARVDAKKHHWWDVATSAGLAFGYDQLITRRYFAPGLYSGISAGPDGGYVSVHYTW